ncbi:MAG: AraC family transcriptional regulator [Chitinophagaceae bacterium]
MHYQTFIPPDILKPYIKYFWALESNGPDNFPTTFSAIVDGCPGAIIVQSEKKSFSDEEDKKLPDIFLYGQTIRPVRLSAAGKFDAIGICFQPHALKSVFGLDAVELTNSCVDLNLVNNKKQKHLSEQLLNATSVHEQLKILSVYLVEQVKNNHQKTDDTTQFALTQIIKSNGSISLKELQQQLQLSERSLERKFNRSVGISPKLFSRICQFQQSMKQLRKSDYDKLSDIAYEHNYADQSHFIRVFKEFTGFSPIEFKKQSQEVVENFPTLKK